MNFEEAITQLQAAHGDPDRLTLATLEIVLAGREPGLRSAIEAAAIPHWFDADILAGLIGEDEASRWLEPITALSLVEAFPARGGWNVHEATRLALRRYLINNDLDRLKSLSSLAVDCFHGEKPAWLIETLFHRLAAGPDAEAAEQLRAVCLDWERNGRHEWLQFLGRILDEARRDVPMGAASRLEVLAGLVWIRGDNLPLSLRKAYTQEALSLALGIDDDRARFEAHWAYGSVLLDERKLDESAEQFQAMARIAQSRVEAEPQNTDWLRRLSAGHELNGDVLVQQSNRAEALERYHASLGIREQLAERNPANVQWQRDVSVSHNRIGNLLAQQGERAGALEHYQASHAIFGRLMELDPANAQWQRDLSVSHGRVGDLLEQQGDRVGALEHYQAGLEIRERLAGLDPANAQWQRDLAVSHGKLAQSAEQAGEIAEALAHYRLSLSIMETLAGLDPEHAQWSKERAWLVEEVRRLEGV